MLDPAKPNKLTILGKDLVAWFNTSAQQWEVLEDRCPHRQVQEEGLVGSGCCEFRRGGARLRSCVLSPHFWLSKEQ